MVRQEREEFLSFPMERVVLLLQRGHRAYFHGPFDEFDGVIGESCVAHLAFVYEPVYLPPRVFYGRLRVNVVHLIEVNMVCLKPGKRLLDLFPNRLRPQVHVTLTIFAADRATLGEDQSILPSSFEGLAHDHLCPPPSIRSEEHTSELQSQSNLVCRLLLV